MQPDKPLSPYFWLWIPLIWMAGQLAAEACFSTAALESFHGENGLHEWLQFAMLIGAFVLALRLFLGMDRGANYWLSAWIAAAALGSFYVAGEEISWGQWIFYWDTPEHWAAMNGQGETNLHNNSRWLNQIPRYALQIGVLIGGIIIPALSSIRPGWVPARFAVIYPPKNLCIIALILLAAVIAQKAGKVFFDTKLFARASEVEELYIYYFVLLYMIALWRRILPA